MKEEKYIQKYIGEPKCPQSSLRSNTAVQGESEEWVVIRDKNGKQFQHSPKFYKIPTPKIS